MRKIVWALLALTFVLALMPAQEAKASGGTCPSCKNGELLKVASNEKQHAFICTNSDCEYYSSYLWENHYGGTANCQSGPICDACDEEYGNKNPNEHDLAVQCLLMG